MDLHRMTIHQLHDLLVKKEATSKEITEAFYRRIRRWMTRSRPISS